MLVSVSVGKAEQPSATRVRPFNGSLAAGQTLHVENISGDIVASPGRQFSAVVTLTVSAATPGEGRRDPARRREIVSRPRRGRLEPGDACGPGSRSGGRGNRHGRPAATSAGSSPATRSWFRRASRPSCRRSTATCACATCDGELNARTRQRLDRGPRRPAVARRPRPSTARIDAVAQALSADAEVSTLQTVNGHVALTLPKDAKFDLSASTMNGTIASTFPLPPRAAETMAWDGPPAAAARARRSKADKEREDRPVRRPGRGGRDARGGPRGARRRARRAR